MLIFLTGNYCFFNLLTIALCLLLLDDAALKALLPARLRDSLFRGTGERPREPTTSSGQSGPREDARPPRLGRWPLQVTVPLAAIAVATSLMHFSAMSRAPHPLAEADCSRFTAG